MKNRNVLIAGQIGSGKTTLARELLRLAPRAVVLDPEHDYEDGEIVTDFREAMGKYIELRQNSKFHLIFRGDSQAEYMGLLKLIMHAQNIENLPPLALFLEGASGYSDTHNVLPEIGNLYRKGRHWRINTVSVIQVDTDIHRVIRSQSQFIVSMYQMKLSTDFQRFFDEKIVRGLKPIDGPGIVPEQGKHFTMAPEYVDLYKEWSAINNA